MKGIYVLENSPTSEDLYWICRARSKFNYLTVTFSLPAGKSGQEYSMGISRVRKLLNHSVGLSIDFFREGRLEEFLGSQKADYLIVSPKLSGKNIEKIDFPKYSIS